MAAYAKALDSLKQTSRTWLVTGVAGFIGSHIAATLLQHNQRVLGLDNFSTGKASNMAGFKEHPAFRFTAGSILDTATLPPLVREADYIVHQAALGSVPRSVDKPLDSHLHNVTGTLQLFEAARACGKKRVVYASSSAVYGDTTTFPQREGAEGNPVSPYAATKRLNEIYAATWARCYGIESIGLRYFNVYGARQDPYGPYACVIPRWAVTLLNGEKAQIFGDGLTSRDYCYIDNVVQANILAAMQPTLPEPAMVFNIACGDETNLNDLYTLTQRELAQVDASIATRPAIYGAARAGDMRHTRADISLAQRVLGYHPTVVVQEGIKPTLAWYAANTEKLSASHAG